MWIQSAALTYTGITLLLAVVVLFLALIVMSWKVRVDPPRLWTPFSGDFSRRMNHADLRT